MRRCSCARARRDSGTPAGGWGGRADPSRGPADAIDAVCLLADVRTILGHLGRAEVVDRPPTSGAGRGMEFRVWERAGTSIG